VSHTKDLAHFIFKKLKNCFISLFLAFLRFLFLLLGNIEGKGMAFLFVAVLFNILFSFYVLYGRIKDLLLRRTLNIKLGVRRVIAVVSGLIQVYVGRMI
jgi:hypothetical protein